MDRNDYLAALSARDGRAFADSVTAAGLAARVASCPEWNVADLVWHLAEVQYFWGSIVSERAAAPDAVVALERPPDADLTALYEEQFGRVQRALTDTDPATEVWTWSSQHDVAFIIRRMAQETAVHRWDAGNAANRVTAVDATLASDGIDEFLHHFLELGRKGSEPIGGSVHIHCTDVSGEWTITPTDDGHDVKREHAKGDCALRGTASDLLLALWRRVPIDALDVVGDTGVASRFIAASELE